MTEQEVKLIATMIKAYYPQANIFKTEQEAFVWIEELSDKITYHNYDYQVVLKEVKEKCRKQKYPPTIQEVIRIAENDKEIKQEIENFYKLCEKEHIQINKGGNTQCLEKKENTLGIATSTTKQLGKEEV